MQRVCNKYSPSKTVSDLDFKLFIWPQLAPAFKQYLVSATGGAVGPNSFGRVRNHRARAVTSPLPQQQEAEKQGSE